MTHREKVERFIAEATERGFRRSQAAPPFDRLLWRLGFETPPSMFLGFWPVFFRHVLVFGAVMLLSTWLLPWGYLSIPVVFGTTLCFGACMAVLDTGAVERLRLPPWDEYPRPNE